MNIEKDMQLFLSLMDTMHDYGNVSRVKNVFTDDGIYLIF
jgi:hypothetical protein